MGNTFVHGYVVSEERAQGMVRALQRVGFTAPEIEMVRQAPSGRPLAQPTLRKNTSRDVRVGAICGGLAIAPLGPMLPYLVAEPGTPARLWVLVSETTWGATMELGLLGALCGALTGFAVGVYRARRTAEHDARYFVGVHAGAAREQALDTMQQMGSSELVAEDE